VWLSAAVVADSAVCSRVEIAFVVDWIGLAAERAGSAAGGIGSVVATAVADGAAVTVCLQVEIAYVAEPAAGVNSAVGTVGFETGSAAGRIGFVAAFAAGPEPGIEGSAVEVLAE
jgi:hypothetical protein